VHDINITVFWDVTLCSLISGYQCISGEKGMSLLYSKDRGSNIFQMLIPVYKTAQFHIPEDSNLKIHRRGKHKYQMCDDKYLKYATYIGAIWPKNRQ
jgi:hypothetical protein